MIIDITLTLSPITPLDVQFDTPSPSPPIFGYPIPYNLLELCGTIFTKALGRERIKFLINKLGMGSFTLETLKQLADEAEEYDKDRDPSVGLGRGKKRRKSSKDAESSKDSRSKEKKSSSTSKDTSQSQHKSSGKSAHAKEPSHTIEDSGMQQDQEFITGDNDEQPADKEVTKADRFKKPERPLTPDPDLSKRQHVDFQPPQTWISQVAHAEEPPTSFDELNDTSFDFAAFVMNRLKIPNLTQEILDPKRQRFYRYASNLTSSKDVYSRRRIIAVTKLKIMKKYDYSHLEEIEVRRDDQKLYTFKEDPHRIKYVDQNRRKRLMRADELYKFSDGTLNDIRYALYDIAPRIRMEYLPMRKWSNLDKKRARVMVQDIDKQLYQRRLMRNLEKFVGGRVYKNDLRLLERTI
ncbi:hypothetical protein Tco_0570419 [Tanacetum coccineum]